MISRLPHVARTVLGLLEFKSNLYYNDTTISCLNRIVFLCMCALLFFLL